MNNNEFIYIYNFLQAEFYFSKGIVPVKIGTGSKGDTFIQFKKTDEIKSAFIEWCTRFHKTA